MKVAVLGAGVAGLSTAYFLRDTDIDVTVWEAGDTIGGLARSFKWHGFDCDIGPHRMYPEDPALLQELCRLVPMRKLNRNSRIFIQGRWIKDPVNIIEFILKFFPVKSMEILWTYLFRKTYPENNFENIVLNTCGSGLNKLFFQPYTEKLFGIPPRDLSPTWAKNKLRIGGLKQLLKRNTKLYFQSFYYPTKGGYGAISKTLYHHVQPMVNLNHRLTGITPMVDGGYQCQFSYNGDTVTETCDLVVSSLSLPMLADMLGCKLDLQLRPARFVYLLINKKSVTPYHWFYLADKHFIINRVSEPKNFGGEGLPENKTVLCCEVTQLENFSVEQVIKELCDLELIAMKDIEDTMSIAIGSVYPIYNKQYDDQLVKGQEFFSQHPKIFPVGRQASFAHKDTDEVFASAKEVAEKIKAYAIC